MKKIFPHICLILCVLFLPQTFFAQEKTKAKQIDEFIENTWLKLDTLKGKTKTFVERIKKQPNGTKGLILVRFPITELSCDFEAKLEEVYASVQQIFEDEDKSFRDRITVTVGKHTYPAKKSFEFWIVPEGVEMPEYLYPTHSIPKCCPSIKLSQNISSNFTKYLKFSVNLSGKISYDSVNLGLDAFLTV